jgi:hypothetical protein
MVFKLHNEEADLCNSHIIPDFVYRWMANKYNSTEIARSFSEVKAYTWETNMGAGQFVDQKDYQYWLNIKGDRQ